MLAAGGSRRLGTPKQLLRWQGQSLVRRAVAAAQASRCAAVYAVLGSEADRVAAELAETDAVLVENPAWQQGLSGSIAAGVRAVVADRDPAALLLMLVDQPHVSAALLDRLLAVFDGGMAACRYGGTLGVPAVFGREHFSALERLEGDRGARSLLDSEGERVRSLRFDLGAVDVDTPADWDAVEAGGPAGDR